MIKNIIITLLSAVAIFAADNIVNTPAILEAGDAVLDEGHVIPSFDADKVFIDESNFPRIKWAKPPAWEEIEPISVYLNEPVTNITWKIDATNQMELQLIEQVKTNWLTIERFTNAVASPGKPFLRQIGQVHTNRVLSLIFKGRTNNLQLMVVGKEEYPEQRQIVPEPPAQPARRK
jgi:hypothetical protein